MCFPLVIAAQDCIGVVPAGSVHDFWKSVKAGSEKAGQELDLKIYFRGPHDESQIDAQRLIIDQVMNEACIGLMLAPNTQKRAEDVAKLKAMGIPTVYFDRDTGSADVISVIATDNYQSGVIAGKEMAKKMNHRGNVALLRMKKGVISTDAREKGFIDGATASGLSIVQDAYLGTRVGDARRNAEIALKNNLSSINGIFTPNESTTLGVIMALETMTHSDGIIHIGFDSNPSLVDALDKGTLYGLMVQQPFEMGYKGVYTLYRASLGQAYPSQIATGVLFVTKSNMADPNISRALTMDYE
ncbi:substrate-binding domain-containing protein [Vibrio ostreicida]|nr:substrate-binding domain-containing protein [Vibrio ostreicida]